MIGTLLRGVLLATALVASATPALPGDKGTFRVRRATIVADAAGGLARVSVRGRLPADLRLEKYFPVEEGFRVEFGDAVLLDSSAGGPWTVTQRSGRRGAVATFMDSDVRGSWTTRLELDTRRRRFRLDSRAVDLGAARGGGATTALRVEVGATLLADEFPLFERSRRRLVFAEVSLPVETIRPEGHVGRKARPVVDLDTRVVDTGLEWSAYWLSRGRSGPPPAVDFNAEQVAIVSAVFPATGYGLTVEEVREEPAVVVVRVVERVPGPGCFVLPTAFQYLEVTARVPRTGKPVRFEARAEVRHCRGNRPRFEDR